MAGIFISYRRKESKPHARLIFQDLRKRFRGRVFMDVDGLKPGEQFRDKIGRQLDGCTVLLALMGPQWAQVRDDKSGAVRLFDARDWVRLEITTALQRGITVIPVLIDGAQMPQESELPPELHPLLDRHAFRLDLDQDFDAGIEKLAASVAADMVEPLKVPGWVKVAVPVVLVGAAAGYWAVNQKPVPSTVIPTPIPIAAPKPDPYPPGKRFQDCADDTCPWLVVIPAGKFMMGSPASEPGRDDDEGPQHQVSVPAKFAMGQFEVTQRQWKALMGNNPSYFSACGDECPVEKVSWEDAQAYVKKLSAKTGQKYRLPSEAEWEYAARAGTTTAHAFGATLSESQANVGSKTVKVGSYSANNFGLSDMHGNVWEWVQDCWHGSYANAPINGESWETNCKEMSHVLRGGSWRDYPGSLRSASRRWNTPVDRDETFGFRIARTF
jgi:formylglycine-generating enzyme required for sulfatase activity